MQKVHSNFMLTKKNTFRPKTRIKRPLDKITTKITPAINKIHKIISIKECPKSNMVNLNSTQVFKITIKE